MENRKNKIKANIVYLSKNFQIVLTAGTVKTLGSNKVAKIDSIYCRWKTIYFLIDKEACANCLILRGKRDDNMIRSHDSYLFEEICNNLKFFSID